MADIGDVSRYTPSRRPFFDDGIGATPDVFESRFTASARTMAFASAYSKLLGSIATITGVTSDALVTVTRNGWQVGIERATGTTVNFYDLDDGTYYANESGSMKTWEIVVVGAVVTVTALAGGGGVSGTVGFAWVS